jgi:hypothetical protein
VRFISFPELKLGILNIDQTGEMVYTYGMKNFGNTVPKARNVRLLLTVADEGKQLARRAGGE